MNKLNNYYKNLEWCFSAENTQKYFNSILIENPIITKNYKKNYYKNKNNQIGKKYTRRRTLNILRVNKSRHLKYALP